MCIRIVKLVVVMSVLTAGSSLATAAIDVEWRPARQTALVGDSIGIGLYAVSDSAQNQGFSSAQVIMTWDPTYLLLTGNSAVGAVSLLGSSFIPNDSFGINEANPPADGNAMWVGTVQFGQERPATPAGTLLTTMMFDAVTETPSTLLHMVQELTLPPRPTGYTKMLDLDGDVLGTVSAPAEVTIIPEPESLCALLVGIALLVRRGS